MASMDLNSITIISGRHLQQLRRRKGSRTRTFPRSIIGLAIASVTVAVAVVVNKLAVEGW
jgi:archaellum biogenesis protein FlaJ (TadC family)